MAGMLPGVECARRRRCHQIKSHSDSPPTAAQALTRKPVICLYTSHHESLLASNHPLVRKSHLDLSMNSEGEDDDLDGIARAAKRRLDGRLRAQMKSEDGSGRGMMMPGKVSWSWRKLNWKGVSKESVVNGSAGDEGSDSDRGRDR